MNRLELKQRQSLPLDAKINLSLTKIFKFHEMSNGKCYIAFSGGKDSVIMLHLIKRYFETLPIVFCNTGIEFDDTKRIALKHATIVMHPKIPFMKIWSNIGYPMISKQVSATLRKLKSDKVSKKYKLKMLFGDERGNFGILSKKWRFMINCPYSISERCCNILKHEPIHRYEKESGNVAQFVGDRADDSGLRENQYLKYGCISFTETRKKCMPIGFWLDKDCDDYIKKYNLEISEDYKYFSHTGCSICPLGMQFDIINRFDILKKHYPKKYKLVELSGLNKIIDWYNENKHYKITDEQLKTYLEMI